MLFGQATSQYVKYFKRTNGEPLTGYGGYIYLVPQWTSYPTGALSLTEDGTRLGQYYRTQVPDGEYKIYIDADKAGAETPVLYLEHIYIGENRLSKVADLFDTTYKITPNALDSILIPIKSGTPLPAQLTYVEISAIPALVIGSDTLVSERVLRAKQYIKFINGTDTTAYRSWVRAQNFGTGSGSSDSFEVYLNPDHFKFTGLLGDSVSIQDTVLARLSVVNPDIVTTNTVQTITGNKTLNGDFTFNKLLVFPNTFTGSANRMSRIDNYMIFRNNSGILDTNATMSWVKNTAPATMQYQNILPKINNSYSLGSTSKYWKSVYNDEFYSSDIMQFYANNFFFGGTSADFSLLDKVTIKFIETEEGTFISGGMLPITSNIMKFTAGGDITITSLSFGSTLSGGLVTFYNPNGTYTVTFNESGNIKLNGTSFILGQYDSIGFVYDTENSVWIETTRSDN